MPYKIVVTGPESCGKTSLCTYLSSFYKGMMISEYSRAYLAQNPGILDPSAIEWMGLHQEELNHEASLKHDLVFCDTDALNYQIWLSERYHVHSDLLEKCFVQYPADFYLLCYPDIPWFFDPLRQNEDDRQRIFKHYWKFLTQLKLPMGLVYGTGIFRTKIAQFHLQNHFIKFRTFKLHSGVPHELSAG